MSTFTVIVLPTAEAEMEAAYLWLRAQSPQHAPEWYNGLIDAVLTLEDMPARCAFAPENADSPEEVRQLLYGRRPHMYRVLFTIRRAEVLILHVRHAARKPLKRERKRPRGK